MSDLMKIFENETDVIYAINDNEQGLVSVPKDLKDNIKVFMLFKDDISQEQERNKLLVDMTSISKNINTGNDDAICIVSLVGTDFLRNENVVTYGNEFIKIKKLVNNIYNKLLGEGKIKKENFIKKVELLSLDNRYNGFINWLCAQNPSKFHTVNYQELLSSASNQSNVFINQNAASIFNEPTKQSTMMVTQSNIRPTEESLSIGTPRIEDNSSSGGGPINAQNISNPKTLVKVMPHNNGFIKWYTALFIIVLSIVIGITISVALVK